MSDELILANGVNGLTGEYLLPRSIRPRWPRGRVERPRHCAG